MITIPFLSKLWVFLKLITVFFCLLRFYLSFAQTFRAHKHSKNFVFLEKPPSVGLLCPVLSSPLILGIHSSPSCVLPPAPSPFLDPPLLFGGAHHLEAWDERGDGKMMLSPCTSAHVFNLFLYSGDHLAGFGNNDPGEFEGLALLPFNCQSCSWEVWSKFNSWDIETCSFSFLFLMSPFLEACSIFRVSKQFASMWVYFLALDRALRNSCVAILLNFLELYRRSFLPLFFLF